MAAAVGYAELKLLNGDAFVVEGTLDEVERKLCHRHSKQKISICDL